MANEMSGVLSGYFQKEKAKGTKAGGASPYSAPIEFEPAGPAPGASVAKTIGAAQAVGGGGGGGGSAQRGPSGGGTGFVSFGQYFGANAPAIQAQAQKAVQSKGLSAEPSAWGQAGGYQTQKVKYGQPIEDPYASQIAGLQAQSAAFEPAAQTGFMGEGVSAFDQLLGKRVTQQAAQKEQQKLGSLRKALESEQGQYQQTQEKALQKEAEIQKYNDYLRYMGSDLDYRNLDPITKRWIEESVKYQEELKQKNRT